MKAKSLHSQKPPLKLVKRALAVYFASELAPTLVASPSLLARNRQLARAARQLEKLHDARVRLASEPGSLREHFEALAGRAKLEFNRVVAQVGIAANDETRRLILFARRLGLSMDEVVLRVKCEFAEIRAEQPTFVRARRSRSSPHATPRLNSAALGHELHIRESAYTTAHRGSLKKALKTVAEVYEAGTP